MWRNERDGRIFGGMEGMGGGKERFLEEGRDKGRGLKIFGVIKGIGGGKERSLEEWKGWEEGSKDLWRNGRDGRKEKIF